MDALKVVCLRVCKLVLWIVEVLVEPIFHTSITLGSRQERQAAQHYQRSAHLVKIWSKATTFTVSDHDLDTNFLYLHHSYEHPRYILQNDNVTLHSLNTETAIFVVSAPEVRAADSKVSPFFWEAGFRQAKYLVVLPLHHLHTLAEEAGDPTMGDRTVTFIHMTVRCGSTILGQTLEALPKTRLFSEPMGIPFVTQLYLKGLVSYAETVQNINSVFRILCKREKDIDHVVMKLTAGSTPAVKILKEKYPAIKLVLNTRHVRPTVRSNAKTQVYRITPSTIMALVWMVLTLPHDQVFVYSLPNFDDLKWWKIYRKLQQKIGLTTPLPIAEAQFLLFYYYNPIMDYLNNRDKYSTVVLYEELQDDPKAVMAKMLTALNIPMNHLPLALSALSNDSQRGFFAARGQTHLPSESETLEELDSLFRQHDIALSTDMSQDQWRKIFK